MGLTKSSTGASVRDAALVIKKQTPNDKVIALAGNPNVGKSTVFNALTGMNQHTGNWPGKTVANAQGYTTTHRNSYVLVDIPGTYSLMAHSVEEEIARNFICFGTCDAVVIVCDATCLERNLNLVLQTLETNKRAVICLNLMDEAKRKGIRVNTKLLEKKLGARVVCTIAHKKKSLDSLMDAVDCVTESDAVCYKVKYSDDIEEAIESIIPYAKKVAGERLDARWLSIKLLDINESLKNEIESFLGNNPFEDEALRLSVENAISVLNQKGYDKNKIKDDIAISTVITAEAISISVVTENKGMYNGRDRKIDRILTSKAFGYPLMVLLLLLTFWITLEGANYPSQLLSKAFNYIEIKLYAIFEFLSAPEWLSGALISGMYRVLGWVVSVMLPPMAIFFPLFTLLEDSGYLPRIAYNLDKPFKKCNACGKQALTMW